MKVTAESLREELHGWDVEEVDDEVYSAMEIATGDEWRIRRASRYWTCYLLLGCRDVAILRLKDFIFMARHRALLLRRIDDLEKQVVSLTHISGAFLGELR